MSTFIMLPSLNPASAEGEARLIRDCLREGNGAGPAAEALWQYLNGLKHIETALILLKEAGFVPLPVFPLVKQTDLSRTGQNYFIWYAEGGEPRLETFKTLPNGVYCAAGYQNADEKGLLYYPQLTPSGVELRPLLGPNFVQVRLTDESLYGKVYHKGWDEWQQ